MKKESYFPSLMSSAGPQPQPKHERSQQSFNKITSQKASKLPTLDSPNRILAQNTQSPWVNSVLAGFYVSFTQGRAIWKEEIFFEKEFLCVTTLAGLELIL